MNLTYKSVPFFDAKAEGDGSTFSGYCAVFSNCDSYGDVITPDAFKDTLADFLANGQILFNHCELIGKPIDASVDAKGLFVKGQISDTARGRDTKTLLKDGVLRKMSIGYRALGRKPTNPDEVKAYWKSVGYVPTAEDSFNLDDNRSYLHFLTSVKVYEASPVGFPANPQADITDVKSWKLSDVKHLGDELRRVAGVKSGRKLSKATTDRLKAVHAAIAPACDDLKALLDTVAGDDADGEDDEPADDPDKGRPAAALAKARSELLLMSCNPLFTNLGTR